MSDASLDPDLPARVAARNAELANDGRCVMHNSYESIAAEYLLELSIGNVLPLCAPCCAWWRSDAKRSGDSATQPVSIRDIASPRRRTP